jgi:hypothetical protein
MRPMIEFRNQFRSYAKRAKEAKEALIVSQLDFKKAVQTVKEIMLDLALE